MLEPGKVTRTIDHRSAVAITGSYVLVDYQSRQSVVAAEGQQIAELYPVLREIEVAKIRETIERADRHALYEVVTETQAGDSIARDESRVKGERRARSRKDER